MADNISKAERSLVMADGRIFLSRETSISQSAALRNSSSGAIPFEPKPLHRAHRGGERALWGHTSSGFNRWRVNELQHSIATQILPKWRPQRVEARRRQIAFELNQLTRQRLAICWD